MKIVVLGDLNLDVLVRQPDSLRADDEARSPVVVTPGGSAGTFARIAATHGASVVFFGAVGTDPVGDLLERSLVDAGVEARLRRVEIPSGAVVALHRGDDRSMICARGANNGLAADGIDPAAFTSADHLHVSGYALLSDSQRAAARRAIELARCVGASISVDPPPSGLIDAFGLQRFLALLDPVDWIFPNLTEARLLSGAHDPAEIVPRLSDRFAAGALTMGRDGAIAWRGPARDQCRLDDPVDGDTTGAGDAFAAGFVTALLADGDLARANRAGCATAQAHLAARRG